MHVPCIHHPDMTLPGPVLVHVSTSTHSRPNNDRKNMKSSKMSFDIITACGSLCCVL